MLLYNSTDKKLDFLVKTRSGSDLLVTIYPHAFTGSMIDEPSIIDAVYQFESLRDKVGIVAESTVDLQVLMEIISKAGHDLNKLFQDKRSCLEQLNLNNEDITRDLLLSDISKSQTYEELYGKKELEVARLHSDNEKIRTDITDLTIEIQKSREDNILYQTKLSESQKSIIELKNLLDLEKASKEVLKSEMIAAKKDRDEAISTVNALKIQIDSEESYISDLRLNVKNLNAELAAQDTRIENLSYIITDVRDKYSMITNSDGTLSMSPYLGDGQDSQDVVEIVE